jgi:general secretion pathway protein L
MQSGAPDAVTAYCLAAAGASRSFVVAHAPLTTVLDHAGNRRIILLVPSSDVRLTHVTVPAKQTAKVLQAAPYALEDQMAEDVETLHFALGPRQIDGSHPVAVVAKARMDEWLALLRERGLQAEAVVPETLCLPATEPERWSALAEPGHITVRTDLYAGFGCLSEDLLMFLEMASPEKKTPLRIVIPRNFEGDLTQLQWPVELLPGFAEPLEALLQNYQAAHSINLLQGDYSQSENLQRHLQPWRMAGVLAASLLALVWTYHGVQAFKLGRELRAQDERNVQRYQQIFPAETRIVDLASQTEQHLAGSGGKQGDFASLLESLAGALAATPGLNLQSVQFREGALFVGLTGTDLQQLETLRAWFGRQHSISLDVQSANAGTDGVQIRLKLSPA